MASGNAFCKGQAVAYNRASLPSFIEVVISPKRVFTKWSILCVAAAVPVHPWTELVGLCNWVM
jgi:hypothetical protein